MTAMDSIFSRRSIRSYTGEAPSKEELAKILSACYAAPVGMGRYDSLHVTVVKNADFLALAAVLDGVFDQIVENLIDRVIVCDKVNFCFQLVADLTPGSLGKRREHSADRCGNCRQIEWLFEGGKGSTDVCILQSHQTAQVP